MNLAQILRDLQVAEHFLKSHSDRHAASCARSHCPICVDAQSYIEALRRKVVTSTWRLSPAEAEVLIGATH